MLVSFVTSYWDIDSNKMVVDYKKIANRYIRNGFLFDLITFIPFAFIVRFRFSRLLILIKCLRLQKLSKFLDMNTLMRQIKGVYKTRLEKDMLDEQNEDLARDMEDDKNKIV